MGARGEGEKGVGVVEMELRRHDRMLVPVAKLALTLGSAAGKRGSAISGCMRKESEGTHTRLYRFLYTSRRAVGYRARKDAAPSEPRAAKYVTSSLPAYLDFLNE